MDRRIRYLQKRIPELKRIEGPPHNTEQVFFGAWVTLEDEMGEEVTYRIVGADEFVPQKNWISVDSPMARALLGKSLEEEIQVETPSGRKELPAAATLIFTCPRAGRRKRSARPRYRPSGSLRDTGRNPVSYTHLTLPTRRTV